MNKIPVVTIMGRQNVGKSTLYNAVVGRQLAITEDYPGVTRDILKNLVTDRGFKVPFYLCDSPGLDLEKENDLTSSIIDVSFRHLRESDLIVFLLDKNNITPYDDKLIKLLLKDPELSKIPVIYCVNKSDNAEDEFELDSFYQLGLDEILPISAKGRRNLKLLFEKIDFYLPDSESETRQGADVRFAIIGKPNAGKSSLVNAILGFDRTVVSSMAGTTRDSSSEYINYNDKLIELVDTAGIRKQSKSAQKLEFYAYKRALRSADEADIIIMMIDASKMFGDFDKKIFQMIQEKGKPVILAVNKWDLVPDKDGNTLKDYTAKLINRFPPAGQIPVVFISAVNKQRVTKLLDTGLDLFERSKIKISTSDLNKNLRAWISSSKIRTGMKKPPKLLYSTQISSSPVKFLLFVNHAENFKSNTITYITKKIRDHYNLHGLQILLELRSDRK